MGAKVGFEGFLYYAAAGIGGTPEWNEIENARDVSMPLEAAEADLSSRKGQGWKQYLAGLKDASIEFDLTWDGEDAAIVALRDAFLNRSVIGLAVMDDEVDAAGAQGLQIDVVITGFGREEPLEEGMTVPVTVKPAYSANVPQWVTVAA